MKSEKEEVIEIEEEGKVIIQKCLIKLCLNLLLVLNPVYLLNESYVQCNVNTVMGKSYATLIDEFFVAPLRERAEFIDMVQCCQGSTINYPSTKLTCPQQQSYNKITNLSCITLARDCRAWR